MPNHVALADARIPTFDNFLVHFGDRAEWARTNIKNAVVSKMGIAREKEIHWCYVACRCQSVAECMLNASWIMPTRVRNRTQEPSQPYSACMCMDGLLKRIFVAYWYAARLR